MFAPLERGHNRFFFFRLHLAVEHRDPKVGKHFFRKLLIFFFDGPNLLPQHRARILWFFFVRACFDTGADDERLPAAADLIADEGVGLVPVLRRNDLGRDRPPPPGKFRNERKVKIAEERKGERAGDRGRAHAQEVRQEVFAADKRRALFYAEAVLFINDDEAEVLELHRILYERVRAEDDGNRPVRNLFLETLFGRLALEPLAVPRLRAARGKKCDRHFEPREQGAERVVVLARENLGRRHERNLAAVPRGDDGRKRCHDGFARTDVALEQTVHRSRPLKVGHDLRERLPLVFREREGQARDIRRKLLVRYAEGRRLFARQPFLLKKIEELQHKKILKSEPLSRVRRFFDRGRKVDRAKRIVQFRDAGSPADRLGERVGKPRGRT